MSDDEPRDAGFDDWLDAVETGEAYYVVCPDGHGALPPRRVCPDCGSTTVAEKPLPATGELTTFTVVHVGTPAFDHMTPYVTAIADFGPASVTGIVEEVDPEEVETGLPVELGVGKKDRTERRILELRRV